MPRALCNHSMPFKRPHLLTGKDLLIRATANEVLSGRELEGIQITGWKVAQK